MFRIYLHPGRINLLRCRVNLQPSSLRQIHSSSIYNLPKTSKSSELPTPTDENIPVKRTRRKTVTPKVVEGPDELLVKAKKTRGRKSATSTDVEEDISAIEPVKRGRRKSAASEGVEEDLSAIEPVKRRRKSATSKAIEEDGPAVEPVKRRRRKSMTSEDVEEDTLTIEPLKRRRKSATSEAIEEDGSAVEPVKRRRRKSTTSEGIEEDDSTVEPAKLRRRKSTSAESVVEKQDESITHTSPNTSDSIFPPAEPVKQKAARPRKAKVLNSELEGEPVMRSASRLKAAKLLDAELEQQSAKRNSSLEANVDDPESQERMEENNCSSEEPKPIKSRIRNDDRIDEKEFIKIDPTLKRFFTDSHKMGSAMGDRTRINIVNDALCDDILDRLKPSLLKHVGCDVIDINPGIGLWSSKIHDVLKPRTHLLMEPDAKKYIPYLQPLLDAKDSTYQHIPKPGTVWEHLGHVTTPTFLPHQVKLSPDDPKINEPNNTLLVIANLGHFPRKRFRGFESISSLVLYQLLAAARSHALFHQYGLIRMLVWIPDMEKTTWLVRNIAQMRKNAVEAQITTKYIREIASSTEDNHRFVRDSEVAQKNSLDVISNMDRMGITTPKHRQGSMEIQARQSPVVRDAVQGKDFDRFKRAWSDEYTKLRRKLDEGTLQKFVKDGEVVVAKGTKKKIYTYEFQRLLFLTSKIKVINFQGRLTDDLINDYNEINKFHGRLTESNPNSVTQRSRDKLKAMIEAYDAKVANLPIAAQKMYNVRLDGARIPTEFEKRETEPLKVYAAEFTPPSQMCLLDVQPQALWPILRENYPENYDIFEFIIGTMYATPVESVYESLEGLWPGALEYIVDQCPSLTDPSKGGSFSLKHMSVRSMTNDMLKEIMEAWMKWPFRPSRFELLVKSGSMVHDPDSAEEDALEGV
ncbi:hypothetical protein SBOR_8358 [Sclerotinia borealis F-4128]|uniref:Mitochondrial transcription factor 1 n=1 Tax=Sclerotinia borealis (strain F-4128) TaxID=1432307 RepID=W9C9M4_SCLBF|nr:hypothetical protein SBOR_8358 [Sclerotinia borealis F-4128]